MIFKFEAQAPKIDEKAYAFNTATLIGKVELKEYASVWPGVTIRGDVNRIEVGRYSNIQDNSVLHGALAVFERNLIRERTPAGLVAARARGRMGGRPKRLDPAKLALALKLHRERNHTVEEICKMMGISKSTLYNYLDKAESDGGRVA